jgi:hypothetical protein
MRVLGPEDGCRQVTVAGRTYNRGRDGTFRLPDHAARQALKTGDFTEARTAAGQTGRGWTCDDCGFVALIRDHCGRCGSHSLTRED